MVKLKFLRLNTGDTKRISIIEVETRTPIFSSLLHFDKETGRWCVCRRAEGVWAYGQAPCCVAHGKPCRRHGAVIAIHDTIGYGGEYMPRLANWVFGGRVFEKLSDVNVHDNDFMLSCVENRYQQMHVTEMTARFWSNQQTEANRHELEGLLSSLKASLCIRERSDAIRVPTIEPNPYEIIKKRRILVDFSDL